MSNQVNSIQQKTDELNKLVKWFDGEDFSLEQALDKFKTAEKLAAEIEHELLKLKNEVQLVKQRFDSET